jgi:excisionase family DNA binding protein
MVLGKLIAAIFSILLTERQRKTKWHFVAIVANRLLTDAPHDRLDRAALRRGRGGVMGRVRKQDIAQMLGVSARTVLDMARAGRLPGAAQVGGQWQFSESVAKRFIAQREKATRDNATPRTIKTKNSADILKAANPWPRTGCGIYFLICDGQIVYVGKSINVVARIAQHAAEKTFDSWAWVACAKSRLDRTERAYIDALMPKLNADTVTRNRRLA